MESPLSTKGRPPNVMVVVGANSTGYGGRGPVPPSSPSAYYHRYSKSMPDPTSGGPPPAAPRLALASSPGTTTANNTSRVFFADSWKYKTMSSGSFTPDRPRGVPPQGPPRSATPPNPVRGGMTKNTASNQLQIHRPAVMAAPPPVAKVATPTTPKSPFTRGRSRVFYASDALQWDDRENDDGLVAIPSRNPLNGGPPRTCTPPASQPIGSTNTTFERTPSKFSPINKSIADNGPQLNVTSVRGTTTISVGGSPDIRNSRRSIRVNGSPSGTPDCGTLVVGLPPQIQTRSVERAEIPVVNQSSSPNVTSGPPDTPTTHHFRRSARHRGSSGRKSLDSGFSDSGGEVTSSGPEDAVHGDRSPAIKHHHPLHHKWSPAALTIKSFLRASSHAPTGDTPPKLSMLKCCMGRTGNPANLLAAITGSQHNKTDRSVKSTSVTPPTSVTRPAADGTRLSDAVVNTEAYLGGDNAANSGTGSGTNTGTWPRLRRHQRNLSGTVVPEFESSAVMVASSPAGSFDSRFLHSGGGTKAYKSTRCRETPRIDGRGEALRSKGVAKFGNRAFDSSAVMRNSSLTHWLQELPLATEDECTNTLQNKSVARTDGEVIAMATRNSRDVVLAIHARANSIMADLAKLKRKLDKKHYQVAHGICLRLSRHIHSLLVDCERHHTSNGHLVNQFHRLILAHLGILMQLLARLHEGKCDVSDTNSVFDVYCAIKSTFLSVTETLIVAHIKNVVEALEEPLCLFGMRIAVMSVSVLGLQDNDICRLISASGGIRALLSVCIDRRYRPVWAMALRALATLCCVSESIREMEMSGGVECITDILSERSGSHEEKCEAAGVVAQITSPALENSHRIQGLEDNIPSLMQSLTDLAGSTSSSDGFLLATAAIANLTFLADLSTLVSRCRTIAVLVAACRHGCAKSDSIFVKDQVATVLANMASHAAGRADVLDSGGLVVLLCFLQTRPNVPGSSPEGTAVERVQQKSAIALSRLCCDPTIAKQVVALQGIQRLVNLCKDERERNGSDAVLVACLAVLRKVASACGFDKFKDLDAMELVEPRLLDTFLIYSSRQESFV